LIAFGKATSETSLPLLPNHLIKKLTLISSNSASKDKGNLDFRARICKFVVCPQRVAQEKQQICTIMVQINCYFPIKETVLGKLLTSKSSAGFKRKRPAMRAFLLNNFFA
jgi:hypothetical protein